MNKLVIVTTNFQSIIANLRANIKLGYGVLHKIEIVNEHYRAELLQGDDKVYQSRLDNITEENAGTEGLVRWLSGDPFSKFVEKVMVDIPVEAAIVEGTPKGVVNEAPSKEAVNTTIKRTRKTKEKKV